MAEVTVTSANFDAEVLSSPVPVLVDFWAAWCAPCRMLAPIVGELAEKHSGSLKVGKINVDEEPELAIRYGVRGIPTVLVFKQGEVTGKSVGFVPLEELEALL